MPASQEEIRVVVRNNDGEDFVQEVMDEAQAQAAAKAARVTTNHMVCIDIDGIRMHRWDRTRCVGENHWRRADPDDMEILGPIREVRRG